MRTLRRCSHGCWWGELSISKGNSKMGAIPSVNLPPGITCNPYVTCATDGCYALKAYRMYPNVKAAWERNLELWQMYPISYWDQMNDWQRKHKPEYFRFHSAGDIPGGSYCHDMIVHASLYPNTRFLCFTKQYFHVANQIQPFPTNLSIVLSMWPGCELPEGSALSGLPKAWVQDGTETRIPDDAIQCAGRCDSCGMCWSLCEIDRDVWFRKH